METILGGQIPESSGVLNLFPGARREGHLSWLAFDQEQRERVSPATDAVKCPRKSVTEKTTSWANHCSLPEKDIKEGKRSFVAPRGR